MDKRLGLCGCKDDIGKDVVLKKPYSGDDKGPYDRGIIVEFLDPAYGLDEYGAWYSLALYNSKTGIMYRNRFNLLHEPIHTDFRQKQILCIEPADLPHGLPEPHRR